MQISSGTTDEVFLKIKKIVLIISVLNFKKIEKISIFFETEW